MENTIYLGLSRQMTLQDNMQIIANNVANVNTPGYRGQNLLFLEHISDPRGGDDPLSFVYDKGQYKNTQAGPVRSTGNPLDISLEGPGFIGVQAPDGRTAYTRAGNFQLSPEGILLTQSGQVVSGGGGSGISIPADSKQVSIDEKGVVSNEDGQIGQISIMEFENPQALKPFGDNMYITDEAGTVAINTRVKQGQLEGSNVQAVLEMTHMIDTLRSFQHMQQILQTENERLRSAVQRLTRQG